MISGVEDLGFHLGQFDRGKADLVRGGLAVDKGFGQGGRQHFIGMGRGYFDEIPQDVVMLDLEGGNACGRHELLLHLGDNAAAFVAQGADLVQFGVIAGCDKSAITGQKRWFGDQRLIQQVDQIIMAPQTLDGLGQEIGQIRGIGFFCQLAGFCQTVADGSQITRAATVKREAGQGAFKIGHIPQMLAQVFAQTGVFNGKGNCLKPCVNRL
jgi:hypothetical protein